MVGKKQRELQKYLEKFIINALEAHNFLVPLPIADKILSKKIIKLLPSASLKTKQKWLKILTFPSKENEQLKERKFFCRLARAFQRNDKNFDKLLSLHLKKFGWIGARWYWWDNEWTEKEIKLRLNHFLKYHHQPLKELKYLNQLSENQQKNFKKLSKELKINKNLILRKLIILAQEYAYLRTFRTDMIYRAGYLARNLFYEIARRAGFPKEKVVYLTFLEIKKMAQIQKSPVSLEELKKREQFYAIFLDKDKFYLLTGKWWENRLKNILFKKIPPLREIKGQVAFKGKLKGKVKIVLSGKDLNKVKKGDILVAVMTFPHFVPAMEKASAFVTDEGGILCHAAIVAREMRKPCIIGTKIATKVLKDGDLVEVDADKGVVRIIKK